MKAIFIAFALSFYVIVSAQTAEEINMITLVNNVRTNPKSFIPIVEAHIKLLEDKKINGGLKHTNKKINIKSSANNSGFTDLIITESKNLITYLKKQSPIGPLELSVFLYPITKSHARFLDSTKQCTHIGPNGQTLANRTKNLGMLVGENCCSMVGQPNSATQALLILLLDIGVSDKGHRFNIFNMGYTKISVAKSGNVWVQNFAY